MYETTIFGSPESGITGISSNNVDFSTTKCTTIIFWTTRPR